MPGNYNPAATECWQEAVQIPPVRMVRRGELDADVLAILQANTRLPDSLWGDLNGQLAALELGARRLGSLLDARIQFDSQYFSVLTSRAQYLYYEGTIYEELAGEAQSSPPGGT